MTDYHSLEESLSGSLHLRRRPVAVSFRETPPATMAAFTGTEPAGCGFWRLAAEGKTFYTVPSDHYNCAIGSYTHSINLPAERAHELDQALTLMTGLGYLSMKEIPNVPRLPETPRVVIYAPLGDTPVDPDVVLFIGTPGRMMLLVEAALRAGVAAQVPLLARPTCMALPIALGSGAVASAGCVGNRVYTGLSENELYVAVPGKDVARVANEALIITEANAKLSEYHRERQRALTKQSSD
jgi:uncharacterized protein (DUF169 family)